MIDEKKREHLRRIAVIGGLVRSEKKAAAARANARKAAAAGGRSRSAAKAEAARRNGTRHVARVKTIAEVLAEEGAKFRAAHPEFFEV
jgi:hypothetical protein